MYPGEFWGISWAIYGLFCGCLGIFLGIVGGGMDVGRLIMSRVNGGILVLFIWRGFGR